MIKYKEGITSEEFNYLRKSVGWKVMESAVIDKAMANSAFITSAYRGESIVGTARILYDYSMAAFITDVMVVPEYQGCGIGKTLVRNLLLYITENTFEKGSTVFVNLAASPGNEKFYKKLGFVERPVGPMGAGMTKKLIIT